MFNLLILATISAFISSIWIYYFKLINALTVSKLKYVIPAALGSIILIFLVKYLFVILDNFHWETNGQFFNDLLYYVIKVGLVEELIKLLPAVVLLYFFRKKLVNPIDYLLLVTTSAMGFAGIENFLYFQAFGSEIIKYRALLSTLGHFSDSIIAMYGIVLVVFHNKNKLLILTFILIAAIIHGLFDFLLSASESKLLNLLSSTLIFLLSISAVASIINNALNNHTQFDYSQQPDNNKIAKVILLNYAVVLILNYIIVTANEGALKGLYFLISGFYFFLFVIFICAVRLSRLKLVKNRWQPIKIELPFTLKSDDGTFASSENNLNNTVTIFHYWEIKGDAYNEFQITQYYHQICVLNPTHPDDSEIGWERKIYVEDKVFLKNFETLLLVKLFENEFSDAFQYYFLKPKKKGTTEIADKYPIVSVLELNDHEKFSTLNNLQLSDFSFVEWAYIKPVPNNVENQLDDI